MEFADGSPEFIALQMAWAFGGEGDKRQGFNKFLDTYALCLQAVKGERVAESSVDLD